MSVTKQWELDVCYLDRHGDVRCITKAHCDYLAKTLAKRLADTDAAAAHYEIELTATEKARRQLPRQAALDRLLDASKVTTHDQYWFAVDGSNVWSWGSARRRPHDDLDVRALEEVVDRLDERTRDEVADEARANEMLISGTDDEQTVETTEQPEAAADDNDGAEQGKNNGEESTTLKQRRHAAGPHDYDAAHGSRTAKQGGRESSYGYVIDALVRVAKPGGPAVPTAIERLRISPASTDVVEPTFALIDSLMETGVGITDLCVDRHYSYKQVERWADQLRARGINQHLSVRRRARLPRRRRDEDGRRPGALSRHSQRARQDRAARPWRKPGGVGRVLPSDRRATHLGCGPRSATGRHGEVTGGLPRPRRQTWMPTARRHRRGRQGCRPTDR